MRTTMLIIHFIGLAMGLGTSFAHAFIGFAASKMEPEEANKFKASASIIGKMGSIGLTLLIISGIYLVYPLLPVIMEMPLLLAKIVLVVILTILVAIINLITKKAIQTNNFEKLKLVESIGKITMTLALTIVVIAVIIFN